jgi:hypothetical protein
MGGLSSKPGSPRQRHGGKAGPRTPAKKWAKVKTPEPPSMLSVHSKHDASYGHPLPGSKSEARAAAASDWVEKEVAKLVVEIRKIGFKDAKGRAAVKFITLFHHYENVSDTLVGIMLRAKKRGLIQYDGEMLLQGMHDNVVITVLQN